jgi:RNA polymerase sigma factor (sigma-70 family)
VGLPPFQALLDAHRGEVYRFLHGVAGPNHADDCFQETFLAALRAYPSVRSGENLRAWLFTIAYRKAIDDKRARKRTVPVAQPPDRAVHDRDGSLWHSVRALPPMQRAAVVQRYANDLPYRDIAAIIGCSEAAARQNVREGLKKLKEMLR